MKYVYSTILVFFITFKAQTTWEKKGIYDKPYTHGANVTQKKNYFNKRCTKLAR